MNLLANEFGKKYYFTQDSETPNYDSVFETFSKKMFSFRYLSIKKNVDKEPNDIV